MATGGGRLAATSAVIKHFPVLLLLLYLPALSSGQQQSLEKMLRLKAGNFWSYRGTVEWTTGETPELKSTVQKKQITWKSEIVEESVHGSLKAFLVHGSLADLPWYNPGKQPSDYLWIVYQGRFYEIDMDPGLLPRFHDAKDTLVDLIDSEEPMIELPLEQGKCTTALHPAEKRDRSDLFYCWHFEEKLATIVNIKRLGAGPIEAWRLWYRSNPDHQIWSLAPGIGFIAYDFAHHGTVSEAHMNLVEAHLK